MGSALLIALVTLPLLALALYLAPRGYMARTDRTYMTQNERGFKRALSGYGVILSPLESKVKGPDAPRLEFVAMDATTGRRKAVPLLNAKTGSINLRPQYCAPLPFLATTADSHAVLVDARVQFSLNAALMKYVYQLDDFSQALDTRIQSAFRAEIGKRQDEVLRATLHEVEAGAIERLRQSERDGDEAGEAGMALGVNFHTASFSYTIADDTAGALSAGVMQVAGPVGSERGAISTLQDARAAARGQGVLALRPQQLDLLADVFKGREAGSTAALLAILEMQTRQNIAEALANSGQLVVVAPQDLGLVGDAQQRIPIVSPNPQRGANAPELPNGAVASRHV